MSRLSELLAVLNEKLEEAQTELDGTLDEHTRLLSSGLITSLHLLELTMWIEDRIDESLDLTEVDPLEAWDTPRAIIAFIERHPRGASD